MKKRVYTLLSVATERGSASWYFDIFIISLIVLNVLAIILESVAPIHSRFSDVFYFFEVFSVIVFTIEYLLRLWTADLDPEFRKTAAGNLKYALTPMAIIDLLAVLPFYLPFIGVDLRVLRMLRIFRIFRIFKIARYVTALTLIAVVFRKKKEELMISLIFTLFLLLLAATMMYYVENSAQPEHFSSIPHTMGGE